MVTFPEENFPSVFSHSAAEDWREVDEAGAAERFIVIWSHITKVMGLVCFTILQYFLHFRSSRACLA